MANQSVQNIKGLLSNSTSRTMIILTAAVIGGALVFANWTTSSSQQRPADLPAQVSVGGAPTVNSVPGTSDSARHIKLIKESNRDEAEAALRSNGGEVALPRLTASQSGQVKDPFENLQKKSDEKPKDPNFNATATPNPAPQQPAQVVQQPVQQAAPVKVKGALADEKQTQAAMLSMMNSWMPKGQSMEYDFTGKGAPKEEANAGSNNIANAGAGNTAGVNAAAVKAVSVKAGTIMSAVIMTSVNSDEPGPVLAQIVSGPYAGARLIGKFDMPQNASKLVLSFSVLTMPNAPKSFSISTYAIEPNSGRTALASDVDNHYLQRYGLLSGAALMKGYSQAIMQSGSTQTTTVGAGGVSSQTTFPNLDAKKTNLAALGEVGTTLGAALATNANRPVTVTLNQGTAIGILFMQDVSF